MAMTSTTQTPTQVTEEVHQQLMDWHKRCQVCGEAFALHAHHRIFRSEGEQGVEEFLRRAIPIYKETYQRDIQPWSLHSIQNLVVICNDCHEGDGGRGVHGGNEILRQKLRWSFTCPRTGFNIPFKKPDNPFAVTV